MTATFVLSTGRTGSVQLAASLRRHPALRVERSPRPNMRSEAIRYAQWRHGGFARDAWRSGLPLGLWYRAELGVSRRARMRDPARRYVEINNYLLPELRRAVPGARVIQLVRDPRTFIPSALNRGWCLSRHDRRLTAVHTGELSREGWKALAPAAQLAWYWLRANAEIEAAAPAAVIPYERLFGGDREGLRELLEALGVAADFAERLDPGERANATRVAYVPRWEDWEPDWRAACRPWLERAERELGVARLYPDLLASC